MTSNPLQQCCSSSSDMNIRSQRTMSEPARNASALLAEALKPGASLDQITLALEAILAVTAKGLGGDASAYAQYQALLLELHVGSDPHTEPTRRWMASQVYLVEDRFAPEPAGFSAVPVEEFRKKVDAEIEARSRVRHPMSVHLFQGTPPVEDVRFFLEHHWVRSYNFYSLLAELAFRFENIEDASVFYRNLYGEAGAETPERSHPALLSHLMTYFDIPLRIDFPALHPLEKAYLNNRIRCVRHTDVAWGLALLYAVESVSCVNHRRIYELLQRLGVPEQPSEFHRLHGTQDEIDTEEMWALIAKFAPSEDFQRKFMQSLARHFEINRAYFDPLWEQMQANSLAMA
ncbi:TPA: HOASN domain-containing protein [Pseudomonas aeruginosa]